MSQFTSDQNITSMNLSQGNRTIFEKFKQILQNVGFKFIINNGSNILMKEQSLVVRDLKDYFNNHQDDLNSFIHALKVLCKKEKYLKKALLPSELQKIVNNDDEIKIPQDSLFRILLKVDNLQKYILDILLDEITTNASENDPNNPLRLLLNQLRYLPHINNIEILSEKLIDIMEISTYPSQLEILDSIPEILPDNEYNRAVKHLIKLLDDNNNHELFGAIIDCLNAMNLDDDIRIQIQDCILEKLLSGNCIKIFPLFLDFLLFDYNKIQNLTQILLKIRNALDNIMINSNDDNDQEKITTKMIIFNKLQGTINAYKPITEQWLQVISNIKIHTEHKPIDLLLLFMLHHCTKLKKRSIETVFKKRIKDGLFKCSLLEQLFEKYINQQLLHDYFQSIIEISSSLLRSTNDSNIIEFTTTLFQLLFNNKQLETIYRHEIIDNLILLTSTTTNVTPILKIFMNLSNDLTKFKQHTMILMRLLEKLDNFNLNDIKLIFEILCKLTCSDETLSGFKDEIHMIIRKLLSSSKRTIKYRGIISAVVMVQYIVNNNNNNNNGDDICLSEQSILSINQLTGVARDAASLLDLTYTSINNSTPELLSLYYDQLSIMIINTKKIDRNFIAWLYERITSDFQQLYITENLCETINDIEFSLQYDLNKNDELSAPLMVNIGELTIKSNNIVNILAPNFRILRLLHFYQHGGDISTIDALLGCGIILPKIDNIDKYDYEQQKQIINCLYHCINWFRELISGFSPQRVKKIRYKILERLNNLIELEEMFINYLKQLPDYKLPTIDYLTQNKQIQSPIKERIKTNKPPKKKFKSTEIVDDSIAGPSTSKNIKINKNNKIEQQITFRELDTDVVRLIKYPLDYDQNYEGTQIPKLTIKQLNFILKDYVTKLDILTNGKDLGLSKLISVDTFVVLNDCLMIFPNINQHLIIIIDKLKDILERTDGRHDLPEMFIDETIQLKIGYYLILQCLYYLFAWSGFQHSKNLNLLRDLLKVLQPTNCSQQLNSVNRLIQQFVDRLYNYYDYCLHLNHAVYLIKILECLYSITPSLEIRKKIAVISGKLLSKRWYDYHGNLDNGKLSFNNIDTLLKSYLNGANIKTISGLVGTLQEQIVGLKTKEDCLHMLASIDKQNFHIFYRNLWQSLHERLKIELENLTNQEHLNLWKTVALTLQSLTTIVNNQQTRTNLICFLKKSIGILKIFISHGIPILEIMLRSKPDQVVDIFKTIQTNTRYLHHLSCQSKLMKDISLISYIPQFRLTLESLIYKVKAVLVANNCSEAFWMGNLKNRNLQGEEILSQTTTTTTEDDPNDSDDDEVNQSDIESDDDIFSNDNNNNVEDRTDSDVY